MGNRFTAMAMVVALAVAGLGAALAQDDQPVLLQYKFTPGTTLAYELNGTGAIPMNITGIAAMGGQDMAMDVNLNLRLVMSQACESVSDRGDGTVVTRIPTMAVKTTMQVADQNIETTMDWQKGALAMLVNGQPLPPDQNAEQLTKLLGAGIKQVMKPNGAAVLDAENAKLLQSLTSFSMGGMSTGANNLSSGFPANAVKPGDQWALELKPEESGGFLAGTSENKFEGYEEIEGVRCAKVSGQARLHSVQAMTAPAAAMGGATTINSLDMTIDFTNYFDPVAGELVKARMNLSQNIDMIIAFGGTPGVQAMQLPATIENSQIQMEMRRMRPEELPQAPPR